MVDLKANPYYLSDEDCKWVEETIASMTPEEKVGQLFFQLTSSQEEEYLKELMEKSDAGKESAGAEPYFAEICESSGIYRM